MHRFSLQKSFKKTGILLLSCMLAGGSPFFPTLSSYAALEEPPKKPVTVNTELYKGPGAYGGTISTKADNSDTEIAFGGGEVRFLQDKGSEFESQQLSCVIRSKDGKIIVVDGGVDKDYLHLMNSIREMTGGACYVDAWLITHPQADHVGALLRLLQEHTHEIDIRNIYCHFFDLSWYQAVDPAESGVAAVLQDLLSKLPAERVHNNMKRGDVVTLSDQLSFRVLNDPIQLEGAYAVNSSGLMFDINLSGKHIIILGDMGPEAGDRLLSEGVLQDISADYVQMSHHGQNGVSQAFYNALMPKACIWNTPEWLYQASSDNVNGFTTHETRQWVDALGVKENYCTKDGDVVLR